MIKMALMQDQSVRAGMWFILSLNDSFQEKKVIMKKVVIPIMLFIFSLSLIHI